MEAQAGAKAEAEAVSAEPLAPTVWTRYAITAVAKPRMTQRDQWAKRPAVARYWTYKAKLKAIVATLPEHAHIVFVFPMPASWSGKKCAAHHMQKHTSRPDVDNLHKGLLDALYVEDSFVWDARVTKVWGPAGAIYVRAMAPPELPSPLLVTGRGA